MDQSVIQTFQAGDSSIATNQIESFERSWRSTWTVLEGDPGNPSNQSSSTTGLSIGALVGIAAGAVVVVVASIATGYMFWRKTRRRAQVLDGASSLDPQLAAYEEVNEPGEMDGRSDMVHETGKPLTHEMETLEPAFELPSESRQWR